ncbi:MAG: hypothetical protein JKY37_31030 [Nannocystaceae bacterium]|nr:hypothetical protein [Nannocystaceae bacterium]
MSAAPRDNSAGSARIADNPFYVLELSPTCAAVEVERQGNKLIAMLALGLVEAESYDTPFGVRPRTEDAVRTALAGLRDPEQRLVHEIWASLDPTGPIEHVAEDHGPTDVPSSSDAAAHQGWPDAMRLFGWGFGRGAR